MTNGAVGLDTSAGVVFEPGAVVDGFVLGERLHQGGMATLWSVTHPQRDLPMLMKTPHLRDGDDASAIVGFEVEQMILPRLQGPHVPRFIARGDYTRRPYLVMERIAGESLRPRLDAAPLPLAEVVDIGVRVAQALHELHRQHVIHLDVKPSNVMFRPSGEAVLIDFGLSHHDQLPDLLDEEFLLPLGTGPYMSPEQVQFVRDEPRSDLFSLGVMLYHLLTGERPFGAPTSVRGLRERLYTEPVPPRALRPDCPPWLQEVVLRCLEVQAERRYATAAHLAFDLQNPAEVELTPRAERLQASSRWSRMKRWWQAAGAEPVRQQAVQTQVERNPVVMAAVDTSASPQLSAALRDNVLRLLGGLPSARLACVSVLKTNLIGMDETVDAQGRHLHMQRLIELKHWAHGLREALGWREDHRVTCQVLESPDIAGALLGYAQRNQVDHIIIGARGASTLRRYLGSVSSEVSAAAECTVTVVRAAHDPDRGSAP
jgi:serine/threonine protein kinase